MTQSSYGLVLNLTTNERQKFDDIVDANTPSQICVKAHLSSRMFNAITGSIQRKLSLKSLGGLYGYAARYAAFSKQNKSKHFEALARRQGFKVTVA